MYRKTVYKHINRGSSFPYLDKLAGNLDTQTVEYKQLLGTGSKLENSVRMGYFGTLTITYENKPRKEITSRRALTLAENGAKRKADWQHSGTLMERERLRL
ncbi:hypothetical protein DEO72_LG9g1180 [Vigna unguiculata]|uniref:Uncharacterized protein n=1 Tax=Vigna unguiculata TaxID=3917 RepID=A0A4D6N163_VIGUN|nr:hypothetical protein DEO72_LG9g1180 [Vigna unguiculata]